MLESDPESLFYYNLGEALGLVNSYSFQIFWLLLCIYKRINRCV